ncbi:MAG: sulfurtransferase [Burkholderiales bacterium]|nr:sulfurtransferase [Burkholderiales bacterium]
MVAQIRPSQLAGWLREHHDRRPLVLDVREPSEMQQAHLAPDGFDLVHIPMATLPARLGELDRRRPVACLCHLGGRSQRVAMYLEQQGFEHVANIVGGIHAWSLECDPSVPLY